MKFTNKTIKPFKGRMIRLLFKSNGYEHNQAGIITASTNKHILFHVNKDSGIELSIKYDSIIEIKEIKKNKHHEKSK